MQVVVQREDDFNSRIVNRGSLKMIVRPTAAGESKVE